MLPSSQDLQLGTLKEGSFPGLPLTWKNWSCLAVLQKKGWTSTCEAEGRAWGRGLSMASTRSRATTLSSGVGRWGTEGNGWLQTCPTQALAPPSCFLPGPGLSHHGPLPPGELETVPLQECWLGDTGSPRRGGCRRKARSRTRSLQRRCPRRWSGGREVGVHEKESRFPGIQPQFSQGPLQQPYRVGADQN